MFVTFVMFLSPCYPRHSLRPRSLAYTLTVITTREADRHEYPDTPIRSVPFPCRSVYYITHCSFSTFGPQCISKKTTTVGHRVPTQLRPICLLADLTRAHGLVVSTNVCYSVSSIL